MATNWGDGHGRVLGNFGPKATVEHNGKTYTFSWPSFGVFKTMEDWLKRDARRSLAENREAGLFRTDDEYMREYRDLDRRVQQGYYSSPHGPGFKAVYDMRDDATIAADQKAVADRLSLPVDHADVKREAGSLDSVQRFNAGVAMAKALLSPDHGELPFETVAGLLVNHMEEVRGIMAEMFAANLGVAGPKV